MDDAEFDLRDQRPAMHAIEHERRRLGLSIPQMEQRTGISINSAYAWRAGSRSPMISHLVRMADAMGFEIVMRRKK